MSKILSVIGVAAIVLFIAMQFVGPEKHNRRVHQTMTIEAQTQVPAEVAAILNRACRDCHTETTNWRWYSAVAPFSWLQIADVNTGRQHMDLSEWGAYSRERQVDVLGDVCEQVEKREMPLWYYRLVHPDARLSGTDIKTLCGWTSAERRRLQGPAGASQAAPQTQPR